MTALRTPDGGRVEAGFSTRNDAGDCVVRAYSIATALAAGTEPDGHHYRNCYDEVAAANKAAGGKRSARDGIGRKVYEPIFGRIGTWEPKTKIGTGITVHVTPEELPASGIYILRLSHHIAVWADGELCDSHDSSRDGTRGVYGWWHITAGTSQ